MRLAPALLALTLTLASCDSVMEGYGDHLIYGEGHAWHTWPARVGVGVFANVMPIALLPLLGLEVLTGTRLGYADASTSTALAAGIVLGTPTYVLGLPFASCAAEPPPPPASVADDR